jgi:hypothetical protein
MKRICVSEVTDEQIRRLRTIRDALGLADLVRRKAVNPNDLLEAAIERGKARNAAVNAVVMSLYDYGRKAIEDELPDGPFRGVPFLLKDLGGWLAGVKVTRGSRFFPPRSSVPTSIAWRQFTPTPGRTMSCCRYGSSTTPTAVCTRAGSMSASVRAS